MPNPTWSREWPTEPGFYWFHGTPNGQPVGLYMVQGFWDGQAFRYHAETASGWLGSASGLWLRVPEPEVPTDE